MYKNIFSLKRNQDEPYLTQIFSYLLQFDPSFCRKFINEILKFRYDEIDFIKAEEPMENGQPDIVIHFPGNKKIILENKISATFTLDQIEKYQKNKNVESVYLVYKTISDVDQACLAEKAVSWSEVFFFIKKYVESMKNVKTVKYFLFHNFCSYLKEEGLAMEKVTWEIIKGTKALENLINQIKAALESFKKKKEIIGFSTPYKSDKYIGFRVTLDNKKEFEVNLLYYPTIIFSCFYNKGGSSNGYELLDKKIPAVAEQGWTEEYWHLDSFGIEDRYYLSSSVEKQMDIIKELISNSIIRYNQ